MVEDTKGKSWTERVKGTDVEPTTAQEIEREIPPFFAKVAGVCRTVEKEGEKLCKQFGNSCVAVINKGKREFRSDPSPENWSELLDDFKKWVEKLSKDVTNSKIYKALSAFCQASINLMASLVKTDADRATAWKEFKTTANTVVEVVTGKSNPMGR